MRADYTTSGASYPNAPEDGSEDYDPNAKELSRKEWDELQERIIKAAERLKQAAKRK